jgi:hypothetical protein
VIERRTAVGLRTRPRRRVQRFPHAHFQTAIFCDGALEFVCSVPFHAQFFHKYIPCRCAKLPERTDATERERKWARAPDDPCGRGIRETAERLNYLPHKDPGSDTAGVVGVHLARARLASRDTQDATATPGPSRGHPIGAARGGILQKLEVKFYAVLQLPSRHVPGGCDHVIVRIQYILVGEAPRRRIEQVEGLEAKFEAVTLVNRELFE